MELKSLLYERAAQAIQHSGESHEAVATTRNFTGTDYPYQQ